MLIIWFFRYCTIESILMYSESFWAENLSFLLISLGVPSYAATKFAVRGMTQSWQAELRKDNIRVMLINPSEVATAFFTENGEEREEQPNKLGSEDIAHAITSVLEMRDKGFIPELSVWATNPF